MKIAISTIALTFLFTMNQAKERNFESWDGNNDGSIDKNEFMVNTQRFDQWDNDKDNRLSAEEFQNTFFKLYDNDGDGSISQNEFDQANNLLRIGTSSSGNFSTIDGDRNMGISKAEFKANISSIFNPWDSNSDNFLSKNEFFDKIFSWWDNDKNGLISRTEFQKTIDMMEEKKESKSFWDKIF